MRLDRYLIALFVFAIAAVFAPPIHAGEPVKRDCGCIFSKVQVGGALPPGCTCNPTGKGDPCVCGNLSDPPAALLIDPPVAVLAEGRYETKGAAVVVQWKQYMGSGTCIASEGGKSLVLTCNHIFDERHGQTAPYPLRGTVTHKGTEYEAVAVSGDYPSDLALMVVDGALPVARIATTAAAPNDKVVHYGNASGAGPNGSRGTVVSPRPNYVNPSCHFEYQGLAIEGDSGAGVFNTSGELVAVVCGRTGFSQTNNGRGTPVTAITVTVKEKAPFRLFPRLRDRLESRRSAAAAAAPPMCLPEPPAAAVPAPKVAAGGTTTETITAPDGRIIQVQVQRSGSGYRAPAGAGECPGGRCPLPGSFAPPQFASPNYAAPSGGCSGGSCAPQRSGWYPGKLLGR